MLAEIENKRDEIAELCRRFGIRTLSVFGSAVRDDFDPATSDVDLLVEYEREPESMTELLAIMDAFESLFGRHVDVVDASLLRNPYLKSAIYEERQYVFAA